MFHFNSYTPNGNVDENLWEFIRSHEKSTIYHTREYFMACHYTQNHVPFIYYASNNTGICGVISGVINKNFRWPLTYLTSRAIVYGGPILKEDDSDVLDFLLKNLVKKLKNKVIYIEFRNNFDLDTYRNAFERHKFNYQNHLNIVINLNVSIEAIKSIVSKNKRRNVTKSKNKGCTFTELNEEKELHEAYNLLQMTYKRIGLPLPSQDFFRNMYDHLSINDMFKCFAVKLEEKTIAVRYELLYKDTIYDWYAGSNNSFRKFYPNDFLIYHVLLWAGENGFMKFDFGGAGKPGKKYGVRDHKLKFGGDLKEYGRYLRINKKAIFSIGKIAINILSSGSR